MARETRRTTCNRDCPDACSILAEVEDGRVLALRGDPAHPVTRGFLCRRTGKFLDRQYAADRVVQPLWRPANGWQFHAVSWDEALDRATEALLRIRRESGPASILFSRGGGSLGMTLHAWDALFEGLGPVTGKRGDVCSSAGEAAQEADFGLSDSGEIGQWSRSRTLILWGRNLHAASPHVLAQVKEARRGGARVVLVDPVRHATDGAADEVWQPRPGRDADLALAVARILFERDWIHPGAATWCAGLDGFRSLAMSRDVAAWCADADVPVAAPESLAGVLRAGAGPTAILAGWGLARRCNGGTTLRVLDALAAITGNVGVPGAGVWFYVRRRGAFDLSFATGATARTYPDHRLGEALETLRDPPVRAAWIVAGNPVAMLPEAARTAAALRRLDFVAVADGFLTNTAQCANLVLPTPTLLESDDLLGSYGHAWLGAARPVVPPPAGVRSDLWIAGELARRLGVDWPGGDARAWQQRMVSRLQAAGVSLADLERGAVRNPFAPEIAFEGRRFPTEDGRARLVQAIPAPPAGDPARPLWLMAVSHPASQCSQWIREPEAPLEVTVHPEAAAGVPDGGRARLESALGAIDVRVRHDPRQRRDVALCPKGGSLGRRRAANALIRAADTDLGDGGALYDERVRLVLE